MKIRPLASPGGPDQESYDWGLRASSVERSPSPLRNRYGSWTRNTSTNTGDMGHTPSSNIPWKSNHLPRLHRKISQIGVYVA
jgi:hypothetical protein